MSAIAPICYLLDTAGWAKRPYHSPSCSYHTASYQLPPHSHKDLHHLFHLQVVARHFQDRMDVSALLAWGFRRARTAYCPKKLLCLPHCSSPEGCTAPASLLPPLPLHINTDVKSKRHLKNTDFVHDEGPYTSQPPPETPS